MPTVYVRDMTTGEIVETMHVNPRNERQHERFMLGLLRNMNTDRYVVDDDEVRFEQTE